MENVIDKMVIALLKLREDYSDKDWNEIMKESESNHITLTFRLANHDNENFEIDF